MIKAITTMSIVALVIACSHASYQNRTLGEVDSLCFQSRQWYFYDKEPNGDDTIYYEFVFSDNRRYAFMEHVGEVPDLPYSLHGDTITIGDGRFINDFLIFSCNHDQLVLVHLNGQQDTLLMKPYDMAYWITHRDKLPVWVRRQYSLEIGDVTDRAFAMRLKEGVIRYEDLDSAGTKIEYFEEVEPILPPKYQH